MPPAKSFEVPARALEHPSHVDNTKLGEFLWLKIFF